MSRLVVRKACIAFLPTRHFLSLFAVSSQHLHLEFVLHERAQEEISPRSASDRVRDGTREYGKPRNDKKNLTNNYWKIEYQHKNVPLYQYDSQAK